MVMLMTCHLALASRPGQGERLSAKTWSGRGARVGIIGTAHVQTRDIGFGFDRIAMIHVVDVTTMCDVACTLSVVTLINHF